MACAPGGFPLPATRVRWMMFLREHFGAKVKLTLKRRSKLQIEVDASFPLERGSRAMSHTVDAYLFVPRSLGLNSNTYPKYLFYRDLQTYSELLPGPRSLSDILSPKNGLLTRLKQCAKPSSNIEGEAERQKFENRNRTFCHIVTHAVERQIRQAMEKGDSESCYSAVAQYMHLIRQLLANFRTIEAELADAPESFRRIFCLGDEYLSLLVEDSSCRLADSLQHRGSSWGDVPAPALHALARDELEYRRGRGYPSVPCHKDRHETLVHRRSSLNTYVESVYFLASSNKPEGRLARELLLSMAAGAAMVFATAAAFLAHVQYENWTSTFAVVLVISYMFKDRIKALAQDYLKTKGQQLFFDFKTTIHGQITRRPLGIQRESFGFVPGEKLAPDLMRLRDHNPLEALDNAYCGEHVIRYRRRSMLYPARLADAFPESDVDTIRQVIYFDLTRFARKMENSKQSVFVPDNDSYRRETGRGVYYLHLLIKYQSDTTTILQKFRIAMTRNGIRSIDELHADAAASYRNMCR